MLFTTKSNKQNGPLRLHAPALDGSRRRENSSHGSCIVIGAVPYRVGLRLSVLRIDAEGISLASATLAIVMCSHHNDFLLENWITAFDEAQHIARRKHFPRDHGIARMKLEFLKIAAMIAGPVACRFQTQRFKFCCDDFRRFLLSWITRSPSFQVIP